MDEELQTIPRELDLPEGQNYKLLKAEGIDIVQQLSGDIWTDYNEHDPGVTILEQLCYALTELSYKANLDIVDLLCAKSENPLDPADNAFFPAQDIFPTRPLTVTDYRRLLIDLLYPNVQNAWLVPLEKSYHGINMAGLYQVKLLVQESSNATAEQVREAASQVLNQNRNLCEDFDSIQVLTSLKVAVKADIDLHPDAIGETVLARILFELGTTVTPHVRFDSLEELIEDQELPPDEVFNGPPPKHGFVNKDDLDRSGLHTLQNCPQSSNLMSIVRNIDGVVEVRSLEIGIYLEDGTAPDKYQVVKRFQKNDEVFSLIPEDEELRMGQLLLEEDEVAPKGFTTLEEDKDIPDGYCPILDSSSILESGLISFFIDDLPYEIDTDATSKNLSVLKAQQLSQYQSELKYDPPLPTSDLQASDLEYYYSIQNHFPQVYGVGPYGPPAKSSRERKVYAKQLKAYLLMMEQHMANYLSQLTNFHRLFSLKDDIPQSYFQQIPEIPHREGVLGTVEAQEDFEIGFEKLNKEFDPVDKRRNVAMDHLLARFGEEFLSETYNALNRKAVSVDQRKFSEQLLQAKLKFMRNIEELSRDRGSGMDHSSPIYKSGEDSFGMKENVSTLKKRTTLFFNMSDYGHRSLAGIIKEDKDAEVSVGASRKKDKRKAFTFNAKGRDILPDILIRGLDRDNFSIEPAGGKSKGYDVVFRFAEEDSEEFEEWTVFNGENEDECEMAILFLIRKLRNLNNRSEGFHLIEHQLLRPIAPLSEDVLLISKGKVLLQTAHPLTRDQEEEWIRKVQKQGKKAGNYDIEEEKPASKGDPKQFRILLKDTDGTGLAYKSGFVTKKSADKERKSIQEFLKETDESVLMRQISRDEIVPDGALITDDFYSLTVSAVLPAWPARFRNNKIRSLFEQIIKMNAPAHIAVQCHWVGLEKMADFERIHNLWMTEKVKPEPDYQKLDRLSYCLLNLLRYFGDPADELAETELVTLKKEFDLAVKVEK